MTGGLRHNATLRALFGALMVLVLAIRLVTPAGYMPVATEKGVIVTLCTGQGAMRVLVARDAVRQRGEHQEHDSPAAEHCPYAAMASAPALPAVDSLALLPVWYLPTGPVAFALRTGWIARLAAPPPPSSGPPSLLD